MLFQDVEISKITTFDIFVRNVYIYDRKKCYANVHIFM